MRTLLITVLTLVAVACGSGSSCVEVTSGFQNLLGIQEPLGAVPSGDRWYVATPEGAAWITNADPSSADPGGVTLPVNSEARELSEVGADVPVSAPIYGDASATAPEINEAASCASE